MKKIISMALVALVLLSLFPMSAVQAANTNLKAGNYITVSGKETPAWTEPRSTGTSTSVLLAAGTIVTVVSCEKNSAGNWWAKVANGKYIYTDNLTTYKAPAATSLASHQQSYETNKANVVVYTQPSSYSATVRTISSANTKVTATAFTQNAAGNTWYKTNEGWIPGGNLRQLSSTIVAAGISLNKSSTTLDVGNTETLTATVTPSNTADKTVTWSSSNTSVATVSGGSVKAVAAGTATITAKTHNGLTATCTVTVRVVNTPTQTSTSTSEGGKNLSPGNYVTVSGKEIPAWTESRSTGTSTSVPLAAGTIVTVVSCEKNSANNWWAKVANGKYIYTENLTTYIAPSESSSGAGEYVTTKKDLVVYTGPSSYTSQVRTISVGSSIYIVATHKNAAGNTWGKIKDNEWVWMGDLNTAAPTAVAVTEIKLDQSSVTLNAGKSERLTATILPSNAANKAVTWSSSNTGVATVNGGTVTALSAGAATITAKSSNGKEAKCTVTVMGFSSPPIATADIMLDKKSATLAVGRTGKLTAIVTKSLSNHDIFTFTWSSSDNKVATVNGTTVNGSMVTALSAGTAIITAKSSNGKEAKCTVTVVEPKAYTEVKFDALQLAILSNIAYLDFPQTFNLTDSTLGDLVNYYYDKYSQDDKYKVTFTAILQNTLLQGLKIAGFANNEYFSGDGMYAYCFEVNENQAVFAFRGTGGLGDGYNDAKLLVAVGSTSQQRSAKEFVERMQKQKKYRTTYSTGHSLGGNLAQYVTLYDDTIKKCVAFNPAGFRDVFCMAHYREIKKNMHKITCYIENWDWLNNLQRLGLVSLGDDNRIFQDGVWVFNGHDMANFVAYFNSK